VATPVMSIPAMVIASPSRPTRLAGRIEIFSWAHWYALAIARDQCAEVEQSRQAADAALRTLEGELAGKAPWTPNCLPKLEH